MDCRCDGCIVLIHKYLCEQAQNQLIFGLGILIFKRASFESIFVNIIHSLSACMESGCPDSALQVLFLGERGGNPQYKKTGVFRTMIDCLLYQCDINRSVFWGVNIFFRLFLLFLHTDQCICLAGSLFHH